MSLLESGWPRRLLCLDPVLPLSLHCPGTTHMGLCTQPEGETDTAKRNLVLPQPPEFLCESVSVYSKLKKSFVAEKGGITPREPHVRVGLQYFQSELPGSVPHCVDTLCWFVLIAMLNTL